MSTDQNKARFREFCDTTINGKDVSRFDEFLSPDFVEHEELGDFPKTRDGVRQFFTAMLAAFPDLKVNIDDMIAEGDKVAVRATWTGTHKGEFMGVPGTGNQVSFQVVDIIRFADGKATEHWGVSDMLTMMQQMGVVGA